MVLLPVFAVVVVGIDGDVIGAVVVVVVVVDVVDDDVGDVIGGVVVNGLGVAGVVNGVVVDVGVVIGGVVVNGVVSKKVIIAVVEETQPCPSSSVATIVKLSVFSPSYLLSLYIIDNIPSFEIVKPKELVFLFILEIQYLI